MTLDHLMQILTGAFVGLVVVGCLAWLVLAVAARDVGKAHTEGQ